MRVLIPGVWDLLHAGHIECLEMIKADYLAVAVASDEVVKKDKSSPPVIPLQQRMRCLLALKVVDEVIPYYILDFIEPIRIAAPDVVVLGNYQPTEARYVRAVEFCYKKNIKIKIMPRSTITSTTEIIKKCKSI